MSEPTPTDRYEHVPDAAATGDGRAIAWCLLALADEVQALRLALATAEPSEGER